MIGGQYVTMKRFERVPNAAFALILAVVLMHLFEATVLLCTTAADGSVPMHALLWPFNGDHTTTALTIYACTVPAVWALWVGPELRSALVIVCLSPQFTLLLITALGGEIAVMKSAYADGVVRSLWFILTDQFHRIFLPLIYGFSVMDKINASLRCRR